MKLWNLDRSLDRTERIEILLEDYLFENFEFGNRLGELFSEEDFHQDLIDFEREKEIPAGKTGDVFIILTPDQKRYVLKRIRANPQRYLPLEFGTSDPPKRHVAPGLVDSLSKIGSKERYLRSSNDNYLNQTIISMILNNFSLNEFFENKTVFAPQLDVFYSDGYGYTLLEYANSGTLYDYLFDSQLSWQEVLKEVFYPFSFLKQELRSFNHNDLKLKNILVHQSENGTEFWLSDFDKSSVIYNGCFFYPFYSRYKNYASMGYEGKIFNVYPEKDRNGRRVMVYTPQESASQRLGLPVLQFWTMYSKYPFFLSFDFYTFFYTFFAHSVVYESYQKGDQFLEDLLDLCWPIDQDREIFLKQMNRVQGTDKGQSLSDCLKFYASQELRLRHELKPFFDFIGINFTPIKPVGRYLHEFTETKNGQISLDKPGGICQTNAFEKRVSLLSRGFVATEDQC